MSEKEADPVTLYSVEQGLDIASTIISQRLEQEDIHGIFRRLGSSDQEVFKAKIADILGKTSSLLEVTRRVSDSLSEDALLDSLLELISGLLHAERTTIFVLDEETHELFSWVAQGELGEEIRIPSDQGVAGHVFTSGEAVVITDVQADGRFARSIDERTGFETRDMVCVPIALGGQTIGVIQVLNRIQTEGGGLSAELSLTDKLKQEVSLDTIRSVLTHNISLFGKGRKPGDKKRYTFTRADQVVLESIARLAASAIQNARFRTQVSRVRAQEQQLLNITTAISRELQLGPLLRRVMETVTAFLEADRSTLFLYNAKRQELWSEVAQGMGTATISFPADKGIAGSVFTTGETVNIADAYADARFNPEVDRKTGYRTRSILCMPVRNKAGEGLGVIQVLNKHGGPFSERDERRLEAFCAQASIAIENASLFEEITSVKNYNESMLQSMTNGVLTTDAERRIVTVNQAFLRIFDAVEAPEGLLLTEFFGPRGAWVDETVADILEHGGQDVAPDMDVPRPDGRAVSVNLTTQPLNSGKGERLGCMLVFEDLSTEKRIRSTMARYMSKEVADRLLDGEDRLGGTLQTATVLFSDIRRFTSISEQLGAQKTVSMLNEYFTLMVDILVSHGGILDKYIGDAIMAVFGAPFPGPDDADQAVKTAVGMMGALHAFNERRTARGEHPVRIGIGLNTDEILSGNIGSQKRMDYTVIGDGVNLAARLETASKTYGADILISEFTREALQQDYALRTVDRIVVKGKTRPVAVFEVLDHLELARNGDLQALLEVHERGLAAYRARDWAAASAAFGEVGRIKPEDTLSELYVRRCQQLAANPPPDDWDGTWTMTTK